MMKLLRFTLLCLTLLTCSAAKAATVSDTFTGKNLGITGTGYKSVSNFTLTSSAVYELNAASKGETVVQLRTTSDKTTKKYAGIVTTTSGGKVKSVTVIWDSETAAGRKIDVYGKNEAFTDPDDLFNKDDASVQGTKLGSIEKGKTTELIISGDYTHIGLRSAGGALYATEITINWEAEEGMVTPPTITGTSPFENTTTVSINAEDGADIYYTTDGNEPTTGSTKYTTPFTLNKTATVSAIAVKDGKESGVATKTFEKVTFTNATIEEVLTWTEKNKAYVNLTLNNAKVIYVDGKTIHLRENGKSIMFYNVDLPSLTLNSTVSGAVKMDFELYNEIHEMKTNSFTNEQELNITAGSDTELDATETTIADLLAKKNLCDLVLLKNATIVMEGTGSSAKYYAQIGSEKIQLWGNQKISEAGAGQTTDVYGLCNSVYSGNAQIKPVKIGNITTGIGNIEVENTAKKGIYNLNGVRMNENQTLPAGIYIINGKKVVVNNK